jgi:hypothetical protein
MNAIIKTIITPIITIVINGISSTTNCWIFLRGMMPFVCTECNRASHKMKKKKRKKERKKKKI